MRGFLTAFAPSGLDAALCYQLVRAAREADLPVVIKSGELVAAAQGVETHVLPGSSGIVIGDIYYRHGPADAFDGSPAELETLARICSANALGAQCWGAFLAIYPASDKGALHAFHSPFSSLAAFYARVGEATVISSDARLLLEVLGKPASIDWRTLEFQLAVDDVSLRSTCLQGIEELRCGETLEAFRGHAAALSQNWDPWQFAQDDASVHDRKSAAELLERELLRSGAARLERLGPAILDLSGGLDSSLLAFLCARNCSPVRAVNMYSDGTEGDERRFAQMAASHVAFDLIERAPDATHVDISRCDRAELPRPYLRSFVQETDRLTRTAVPGAQAFVNGTGGDAVFCHLQSSGPAADVLRTRSADQGYLETVREVAASAQCSVWDALGKSLVKSARGRKGLRLRAELSFLTNPRAGNIPEAELPWRQPHPGVLPGKFEQVRHIYASAFNMSAFERAATMKAVYPLMSQPLIEACLRIPSWHWIGRGYNRLPAREIAAKWLPPEIAWRLSKGGLGQLQRDIFRLNRQRMREMLLDGSLQRQGLLDLPAIEQALEPKSSLLSDKFARLLRLCDFEAWAGSWS